MLYSRSKLFSSFFAELCRELLYDFSNNIYTEESHGRYINFRPTKPKQIYPHIQTEATSGNVGHSQIRLRSVVDPVFVDVNFLASQVTWSSVQLNNW
jgi:hypothetical protein